MRSGYGDFFSDGLHYVGEFRNGIRHGRCEKCVFRNGDVYNCEFRDNPMEGTGVMVTAWGAKYDGQWHQGKMCHRGRMLFPSGDSYDGEWAGGRRSGRGVYRSAAGDVYDGEWEGGKRHGKGTHRAANRQPGGSGGGGGGGGGAEVYEGEWRHGLRHGEGKVLWIGPGVGGWWRACLIDSLGLAKSLVNRSGEP